MRDKPTLTPEEWAAWKAHPVTELVTRFMRDLELTIRSEWAQGESWTDEARIRCETYSDFKDMSLEDMELFYAEKEEREREQDSD